MKDDGPGVFILPGRTSSLTGMPWYDSESNLSMFFSMLAAGPEEKILDVGAGRGVLAHKVITKASSEVYAVDSNEALVAKMKAVYPSLKSSLADSESLPYPDSYFDKVYSTLAMHHFSNPGGSMREFARVLKPTGLLLIVEIRPSSTQGRLLRFFENGVLRTHLNFMDMDRLIEIVKESGEFEAKARASNSFVYFVMCTKVTGS